jgi:hypothetical protein
VFYTDFSRFDSFSKVSSTGAGMASPEMSVAIDVPVFLDSPMDSVRR